MKLAWITEDIKENKTYKQNGYEFVFIVLTANGDYRIETMLNRVESNEILLRRIKVK